MIRVHLVLAFSLLVTCTLRAELPPPPARGSDAERVDLELVLRVQRLATAADRERAARIKDEALGTLFGAPYGPLTAAEVARWSAAFAPIADETEDLVDALKKRYGRPRPYVLDHRIRCLAGRPGGLSYPSGAAAVAEVFARLLSRIDPSRQAAFLARAAQIGRDRVVVGAHHPSDVAAGLVLGDQLEERFRGRLRRP